MNEGLKRPSNVARELARSLSYQNPRIMLHFARASLPFDRPDQSVDSHPKRREWEANIKRSRERGRIEIEPQSRSAAAVNKKQTDEPEECEG